MDRVQKDQFSAFLDEARSWETSAVLASKKSERRAWQVAGVSIIVGVLGMAAAYQQLTREPPMPGLVLADKSTGTVEQISTLAEGKITTLEATDKYFAQLYVQYREGWDPELEKENRYRTGLMSVDAEQQRYDAWYRRSEQAPRKVYGENARVRIVIKGTSFLTAGVAAVRYLRLVERPGMTTPEETQHTATVTFSYSSGRMSERDRAINPLGFQVSSYRTDPDTPGDPVRAVAPASAPPLAPVIRPVPVSQASVAPLDLQPLQARGQ